MKEIITSERMEKLEDELILSYAKDASPKIWHQMAMNWNWDGSLVFLNWLADNPKIDKATALMLYWESDPRFFKQYKDKEDLLLKVGSYILETFVFIEKIEHNYLNGFYKNHNFEYDPQNDGGFDWTSNYLNIEVIKEIPEMMFQKLTGEKVEIPVSFTEGLPADLLTLLEKLVTNYEIEGYDDDDYDDEEE